MTPIDYQVSKAVHKAALVEKLLHDRGPWLVEANNEKFEAEVTIEGQHITIDVDVDAGVFSDVNSVQVPIYLFCRDEMQSVTLVDNPGESAFNVEWSFSTEVIETHS